MGSVYKQPETEVDDSCHSWRVQVSGRGHKGETKGSQQGEGKSKGNAPCKYVTVLLCNGMIGSLNDASYRVHNNNNRNECC
jgi:hypothetical protein